ncbi:MAG TPA: hypothetical protein PK796_00705 [Bacteroidales bacterium]|jgi:hypothetical protein|nr:hypothetical protein [Bacteroidales bacterium]
MRTGINEQLRITINSTAYYLISYFIIAFLFQLTESLIGNFLFDIPSVFDRNSADYIIKPESWSFDSVKIIFSSGVLLSVLFGVLCLIVYLKALELDGLLRMFFLWGFVHSMNFFLGSVMLGAVIFEGFGYVLAWMYLQDTAKMIILFISLFMMLATGSLMTKPFLYSANTYYNSLSSEKRPEFRKYQFFLPYILGTIILVLLRFPLSLYELLLLLTPILIILPLWWGISKFPPYFFEEQDKSINIHWRPIITALLMILLYRVVMGFGIRIG